jgi:hypothetical protein
MLATRYASEIRNLDATMVFSPKPERNITMCREVMSMELILEHKIILLVGSTIDGNVKTEPWIKCGIKSGVASHA